MLDLKALNPQYVTDANGEQTAVILPIGTFRDLLEDIEDLAARFKEARRRGPNKVSTMLIGFRVMLWCLLTLVEAREGAMRTRLGSRLLPNRRSRNRTCGNAASGLLTDFGTHAQNTTESAAASGRPRCRRSMVPHR